MTDDERDDVVAAALRGIAVPEHGPAFWDALAEKVSEPVRAPRVPIADRIVAGSSAATRLHAAATPGDEPVVRALDDRRPSRRAPILVAAALLLLVGAVGFVTLGGDGDDGGDGTEVADQPLASDDAASGAGGTGAPGPGADATAFASSTPLGDTTTVAPLGGVEAAAADSPEGVVTAWLGAVGGGDVDTAAALTGPRTVAYVESMGPDVTIEGFLTESQADLGGLASAADLEVRLAPIGPLDFDGGTLQVVVVSATVTSERATEEVRHDVFPVVDDGEGFRVEHLAFDPARDNDPEFTVPAETETGLGAVEPTAEVNVFVPAQGTVYFQLDDGEVVLDETSEVAGSPFALFDPPGELTAGEHVLVLVAVGDDGTVAHFSGSFAVAA